MTFAVRTLMDAGGASGPSGWSPVTDRFPNPGAYTETIPGSTATGGPSQLVVEVGGAGGGGGNSVELSFSPPVYSGSGGSGSICRSTFALTAADWGKTFAVIIQPGGAGGTPSFQIGGTPTACTITNGSFSRAVNMHAGGGGGGNIPARTGGAGGVASGGQVNLNGNAGQGATLYPTLSQGAAGVTGVLVTSGVGGDASTTAGGAGQAGLGGAAAFAYT